MTGLAITINNPLLQLVMRLTGQRGKGVVQKVSHWDNLGKDTHFPLHITYKKNNARLYANTFHHLWTLPSLAGCLVLLRRVKRRPSSSIRLGKLRWLYKSIWIMSTCFFILPRPLEYEAQVVKEVPADRLLIWQVKQYPKYRITKCKTSFAKYSYYRSSRDGSPSVRYLRYN